MRASVAARSLRSAARRLVIAALGAAAGEAEGRSQRWTFRPLMICSVAEDQDGGGEALLISTVEGREVSNSCSGSSSGGVGGGEVAALDLATVDEGVAEGVRPTGVADKTAGSHYPVVECVAVVVVVVVERMKHLIWPCVIA
jgi:hypothetical protein